MTTLLFIVFLYCEDGTRAITMHHLDYPDMKTCQSIKKQFDSNQSALNFVNEIYSWSVCLDMPMDEDY